jgi:hypothetical protein
MSHEKDYKIERSKFFTFRKILYFTVLTIYIISLSVFFCLSDGCVENKIFEFTTSFAIIIFSFVQFEIQHKKTEIETFREYNNRYDKLNDDLNFLIDQTNTKNIEVEQTKHGNKKTAKGLIIDYLVLCSEEFYWRRQGYITTELWENWQRGMEDKFNDYKNVGGVYDIIRDEVENYNKSYYGFFESKFIKKYLDGTIIIK